MFWSNHLDIIDATNIDLDVLVFDTETSAFSHVATVFDMETYTVGQPGAAANNVAFFRDRGMEITFVTTAGNDQHGYKRYQCYS